MCGSVTVCGSVCGSVYGSAARCGRVQQGGSAAACAGVQQCATVCGSACGAVCGSAHDSVCLFVIYNCTTRIIFV
jgi:hypothetical protein